MIINFLGDSITEGYCASSLSKGFVSIVGEKIHAKVNNYGIAATRIAKQSSVYDDQSFFGARVKDMDKNADMVIVFGGTNDYGHGDAPVGDIGDTSPDTFYGGMNYLINELNKYFSRKRIIFILPTYRVNEDNPFGEYKTKRGHSLQVYRDAIVEVLNKHNIEYWDIKDELGDPTNDLYYDGLHPNDKGHEKIAEIIINKLRHE